MYYSSGTYEAFVKPEKPEGVEKKSAYITKMKVEYQKYTILYTYIFKKILE